MKKITVLWLVWLVAVIGAFGCDFLPNLAVGRILAIACEAVVIFLLAYILNKVRRRDPMVMESRLISAVVRKKENTKFFQDLPGSAILLFWVLLFGVCLLAMEIFLLVRFWPV